MVLAFAGDSTITRFLFAIRILYLAYHVRGMPRYTSRLCASNATILLQVTVFYIQLKAQGSDSLYFAAPLMATVPRALQRS